MARPSSTSVLDRINTTGSLNNAVKETLRQIHEDTEKVVYASSDHTVNVSTTLANDAELYFTVKANRKYIVEGHLFTTADGTDGIKVCLTSTSSTDPTAARIYYKYLIDNAANQNETQTDLTSPAPTGVAAAITKIEFNGYIHAAVDTRITLQSALVADNNAATTIHKGSYMKIREVA